MQKQSHEYIRETKAETGTSQEIAQAFDSFMDTFEAFRKTSDERLHQLEMSSGCDSVISQKMDRINSAMDTQKRLVDQLLLKSGRPSMENGSIISGIGHEHKSAFENYMRHGNENGLRQFEEKAISSGSDSDGGYLVPDEIASDIGKSLTTISPVRSISSVRTVSTSIYKKPFALTGPVVGWIGETDARPQTSSPTLTELQFPTMELYAMPAATPALLEDSAINLDTWLAEEVNCAFAEQEGKAFVNGDGVKKPKGFLSYDTVAETSWTWGKLGYIATGADGTFRKNLSSDVLIDAIYSLKSSYRQNAHWVMNRKTQAEIRKLKDKDHNYLWQAPTTATGRAQLLGFPVIESEDMPDMASNSLSIAFGDFSRGYLVIDRTGMRVLRDPYSTKPYVLFYTTRRVGGGVQDFDAIKLIKFSAS